MFHEQEGYLNLEEQVINMIKGNRGKLALYRRTGSSIIMGFAKFFKLKLRSDYDIKNNRKESRLHCSIKQRIRPRAKTSQEPENITSIVSAKSSPHLNVPKKDS